MAVRRIGHSRLPDNPQNTWNVAAPNSIPGGAVHNTPDFGGQSVRELPPIIITEEHMAAREPRSAKPKPIRGKQPKLRAVLPDGAPREIIMPKPGARAAINLRVPVDLLSAYKALGPGYQTKIVAVLAMFIREGGTFTEEG